MNLKKKVLHCLSKYPPSRDSDVTLTNAVWFEFHGGVLREVEGELYVSLKDIYKLPREDNVKRHRAIIQNEEGLYLPTSLEVVKKRRINEEKWREYIRK